MTGLFTSYTANDPQFLVTIDREKAKSLHVPLQQITDTLGVYMGSAYVNDFDFNNRSYRVYVQADKQFRDEPSDMRQYYVRSDIGRDDSPRQPDHHDPNRDPAGDQPLQPVPLGGNRRVTARRVTAPDRPSRPWKHRARSCPQGFTYEWTGFSLEELAAGGTTLIICSAWASLVVYLTLSAQYESFVLPFIVLLAVPMALLGRSARSGCAGCRTTFTARSDW